MPDTKNKTKERPPVIAVMGHIDHGKSTLLDYIRKTNIVAKEAGGITQHISAYEVIHKNEQGENKKITFLDTPGHSAFSTMRSRGARIADIAILVVSAEDGVKPQTLEALSSIQEANIPFIVAINKIDRPEANIEKVKMELAEKEVYLEGYGGQVPSVPVSAKIGTGIDELLSLILLSAELEELTAEDDAEPEGFVLESNMDQKRGITATIIMKNGILKSGMFVVVDDSISTTRIMEDFLGKKIDSATFSSPVHIVGFKTLPHIGSIARGYSSKKEAEDAVANFLDQDKNKNDDSNKNDTRKTVPLIIKADTSGSIEAVEKELKKLETEDVSWKVISSGIGAINEADLKIAMSDKETVIVGFNVKIDGTNKNTAEKNEMPIFLSNIIYELSDWARIELEKRRPRKEILEVSGSAKIQRFFSRTKEKQVVGGKVLTGKIARGNVVRILRRDFEIGKGKIIELQQSKSPTDSVVEGSEFGMLIESKNEIAAGDIIESFTIVTK